VYNLFDKNLELFSPNKNRNLDDIIAIGDLASPLLSMKTSAQELCAKLREDVGIIEAFVRKNSTRNITAMAYLAPVFFGSRDHQFRH